MVLYYGFIMKCIIFAEEDLVILDSLYVITGSFLQFCMHLDLLLKNG
jgi:hypothetical protein